jgi:hypothetical protein
VCVCVCVIGGQGGGNWNLFLERSSIEMGLSLSEGGGFFL